MRPLFSLLSPGGASARLSTLIFHRVLPEPDPLFPEEMHAQRFGDICRWLASWFNVLPLDEAIDRLYLGSLPPRSLALTFDDGYADNAEVAAPLLRRHQLPCTFFVATGFLDGGCMWNDIVIQAVRHAPGPQLQAGTVQGVELGSHSLDGWAARRTALDAIIARVKYLEPAHRLDVVRALAEAVGAPPARSEMMRSNQVAELARLGFGIGGHTVNHPILARLDERAALSEMTEGRERLRAITGRPVTLFAYPNGKPGTDYQAATVQLARRCGFQAAVSTAWGSATARSDRYQLPRFTPWDRGRLPFGLRLASNLRRDGEVLPLPA
jgi:peptidoglycan/xylan/chitin deacetylase (PgdA/CDA1 family)